MEITTIIGGLGESLAKDYRTSLDARGLTSCLRGIGVLNEGENFSAYRDVQSWKRGGAETFNAISEVIIDSKVRRFIAKALFSFASTPSEQLNAWMERRQLLASNKILVPQLFFASKGTLYEEFIDNPLPHVNQLTYELLSQIGKIAGILDQLGFHSLGLLNDVRVKNHRIYYIDFGSDLGSPSIQPTSYAIDYLKTHLSEKQLQTVIQNYF